MRKRILAGNWKLNGNAALCEQFAKELATLPETNYEVVICPPVVYLAKLAELSAHSDLHVGAQDVAAQQGGAYTGEVSADMLAEVGAQYVIVGHSERREYFAETDASVLEKVQQVLSANLVPILCVGESLAVREAGEADAFVSAQLRAIYSRLSTVDAQKLVVAYEPVWAIGTGKSATPQQAQQMHEQIRKVLADYIDAYEATLLYGGSVNDGNAAEILAHNDVDGALIGGASLTVEAFSSIVKAV